MSLIAASFASIGSFLLDPLAEGDTPGWRGKPAQLVTRWDPEEEGDNFHADAD